MPRNGNGLAPAPLNLVQTPTGEQVLADKERIKRPIYDTFLLNPGAAIPDPIEFWSAPVGKVGSGFGVEKSFQNTNHAGRAFQLKKGEAINIEGVEISIYQVGTAPGSDFLGRFVAAFWEDSFLEMRVSDDIALEARLKNFSSGSGVTGLPFMNAVAPQTYIAPQPTLRGVRRLARKIPLASRERFGTRIFTNTNNPFLRQVIPQGASLLIRVTLYGMASRPLD